MNQSQIEPKEKSLANYLTIKQAAKRYSNIFETEGVLRNLIWKSADRMYSLGTIKGNGLTPAIIRIGRRVVLDEVKLIEWIESHRAGQTGEAENSNQAQPPAI
jgi:hypothetical protein